ncbi:MAG TPA: hypothetical protein VF163_07070 [Micromonosporaceae bacterium]
MPVNASAPGRPELSRVDCRYCRVALELSYGCWQDRAGYDHCADGMHRHAPVQVPPQAPRIAVSPLLRHRLP